MMRFANLRIRSSNRARFFSSSAPQEQTDPYLLPAVQKAKAYLFGRISGTFTSVSWSSIEKAEPLFGSIMPYVLHRKWYCNPIIGVRNDEPHASNLKDVPKSSLHIFPLTPQHISPRLVPLPRINITGEAQPIEKQEEIDLIYEIYDKVHPGARKFFEEPDTFKFYEFQIGDVHLMASSGQLTAFSAAQFVSTRSTSTPKPIQKGAKEDPIAPLSRPLINLANTRYAQNVKILCKKYADVDVSEAFVFAMDTLGFDIMGKDATTENWTQFRMPLDNPIVNLSDYEITLTQTLTDKGQE